MSERTIFLSALDIADPTQRAAYLVEACSNDAALRKHIEELIAAEGNFNNGNTGWNVFAIPDQAQQRNYVQISLPNAESVFDFHNFSGDESVPVSVMSRSREGRTRAGDR